MTLNSKKIICICMWVFTRVSFLASYAYVIKRELKKSHILLKNYQ